MCNILAEKVMKTWSENVIEERKNELKMKKAWFIEKG